MRSDCDVMCFMKVRFRGGNIYKYIRMWSLYVFHDVFVQARAGHEIPVDHENILRADQVEGLVAHDVDRVGGLRTLAVDVGLHHHKVNRRQLLLQPARVRERKREKGSFG